ncbi:CAP domain-containing protein [Natrinema sp. HArc-T2]|uniref:CAP domain-containing protein n=1 Tax=Natrinema sp. HArc-T2 TaxID=3242701 RepID=UPI00359D7B79
MDRRRPATEETNAGGSTDRGLVRGLVNLLVAIVLVCSLALGTALFAPQLIDGLDIGEQPSPSPEPPPAGERNPTVVDPGDLGNSSYETDVEVVRSATVEDFVHAKINDRRAAHDLPPLEWDGTVASVARAHSTDMARRDYFAHRNPDGEAPGDRFQDVGDYCRGYGENIAKTWLGRRVSQADGDGIVRHRTAEGLATGLVNQWMNSTSHRQAILEEGRTPSWDRAGVGVYITDDGAVYAGQNFCQEW